MTSSCVRSAPRSMRFTCRWVKDPATSSRGRVSWAARSRASYRRQVVVAGMEDPLDGMLVVREQFGERLLLLAVDAATVAKERRRSVAVLGDEPVTPRPDETLPSRHVEAERRQLTVDTGGGRPPAEVEAVVAGERGDERCGGRRVD